MLLNAKQVIKNQVEISIKLKNGSHGRRNIFNNKGFATVIRY